MGGEILDYPAKRILNQGRIEGAAEERKRSEQELNEERKRSEQEQGRFIRGMVADGIPVETIAKWKNCSAGEILRLLEA
ncbi:MAG: hypothetical protein IJ109_07565 [Firmicutes bacterium]|nr:hypothetical protein [Bacillota bacterium]